MNFTLDYEDTLAKVPVRQTDLNQTRDLIIPISVIVGMGLTIQLIRMLVRWWMKKRGVKNQDRKTNGPGNKKYKRAGNVPNSNSNEPPTGLYFDDPPLRLTQNIDYSDFYYGPATFGLDMEHLIQKRRMMTGPIFTIQEESEEEEEEAEPEAEREPGELTNYSYEHVEMLTAL